MSADALYNACSLSSTSNDHQQPVCPPAWLAQLVKALAAPTHAIARVYSRSGFDPVADKLDSGFHPSGVDKMSSN